MTIDILPKVEGCELTLTQLLHPDWAEYAGRTEAAWTKMLAVLGDSLATHN